MKERVLRRRLEFGELFLGLALAHMSRPFRIVNLRSQPSRPSDEGILVPLSACGWDAYL